MHPFQNEFGHCPMMFQLPLYLLWLIIPLLHSMTTVQIFSVTQMISGVSFLVLLWTLLLVLMVSPLSCSTTQLPVFHFLFLLVSTHPSQQVYFLQTGKTPILYLSQNRKHLLHPPQTITQSLYFPSQARSWNVTYLTICINFVLLTTSSLTVSLVSNQDSQLKQLYYLLSILGFLHLIAKMPSV